MTLPSYRFGNPLTQLLNAEARTCKGCKHHSEWIAWGFKTEGCNIGRKSRNKKCYVETFGINCQGGK